MRAPPPPHVWTRTDVSSKQKKAGNADWAFAAYAKWELEVKAPNVPLVAGLFDRAVLHHPESVELWDMYLDFCVRSHVPNSLYRQMAYVHAAQNTLPKARLSTVLDVAERAVKHLPGSADLYATFLRAIVRLFSTIIFLYHPDMHRVTAGEERPGR